MFWVYRYDLLSLPIFVAGAVAIIFGCRVLWRQKLAIAFLFLAWPYPYEKYLLGVLNAFTDITLTAMVKIAEWTHLATPLVSSDETLFSISHHGTPFRLSVVSTCPESTAWSDFCWWAPPSPRSFAALWCARFSGSSAA